MSAESTPASWKPHESPMYDQILNSECPAALRGIKALDSGARLAFIRDPRGMHAQLYTLLTPPAHPEYAGTYRGTPGTSLEGRRSGAVREDGEHQEFLAPEKVAEWMETVGKQAQKIFCLPSGTRPEDVFSEITRLFYLFGLVHPFLDGNGHIQRLIFAACVFERDGLRLHDTWTIHPRPYDIEIKRAFEANTIEARLAEIRKVLRAYVSL